MMLIPLSGIIDVCLILVPLSELYMCICNSKDVSWELVCIC